MLFLPSSQQCYGRRRNRRWRAYKPEVLRQLLAPTETCRREDPCTPRGHWAGLHAAVWGGSKDKMSEGGDDTFKAVDLEQQTTGLSDPEPEGPPQPASPMLSEPTHSLPETAEMGSTSAPTPQATGKEWITALTQFKLKKFFVLRPGTLDQALEDIKTLLNEKEDGKIQSFWLLAEVDHWNNERERVVLITDKILFICKYDFMMFNCEQMHKIPLNFVDRISHGPFVFPPRSLLTSLWIPGQMHLHKGTLRCPGVRLILLSFSPQLENFRDQLVQACQKAHAKNPIPGKANGVIVLNQPVLVEAYMGLMSFIGNQNKLGYCVARGNVGF
ncbi:tumor protein p63-regulated gene 1-like protein isoform X1 [Arapaima gigas]